MILELDYLKKILKIDDRDKDFDLQFIIDDVTEVITNYCHIKAIPDKLKMTAYRMCMDLYKSGQTIAEAGGTIAGDEVIKKITEGDTTIEFSVSSSTTSSTGTQTASDILDDYKSQLNKFRRIQK